MDWLPMETAPKDGTDVMLRIAHPNKKHDSAHSDRWVHDIRAKWGSGGRAWGGIYGRPEGRRPI